MIVPSEVVLEHHEPRLYERFTAVVEHMEAYRPNEQVRGLIDIDVDNHVAQGRTTLVIDAESTFVEFDGWHLSDEYKDWFASLRGRGVEHVFITTNKQPKSEDDLWQLQWWVHQTGAELAYTPQSSDQRKPSPYMLLSIMQEFNLEPSQIFAVGDKVTGDVLAANLAGVYSILVDRYEKADLPGDRYLRRPFEKKVILGILGRFSAEVFTGYVSQDTTIEYEKPTITATGVEKKLEVPKYIRESSRIVGFGREAIVLSPEYTKRLPPPTFDALRSRIKDISGHVTESELYKRYIEFLEANGEDYGEKMTKIRPYIGALALGSMLLGYKKTATAFAALTHITDHQDGFAIRKSGADLSSERRKIGANDDRRADQKVSAMLGIGQLVGGSKSLTLFTLQNLRTPIRNAQIKRKAVKGFDTKSDFYSKFANEFLGAADLALVMSPRGRIARASQLLATFFRYDSMRYSQMVTWPYRRAKKENAARVKEYFTQL